MTRNYAELERALIDDLAPRTGRDLTQWLAAIDAANLTGKNAIIDWLRPQGFSFANASWLERIHNNGGRPIYLDNPAVPPAVPRTPRAPRSDKEASPLHSTPPAAPSPPVRPAEAADDISALLARGKAFRPLADMLLRELRSILPEARTIANGDLVSLSNPLEFGALLISPRELRLALDLGERSFEPHILKARLAGASSRLTHMLVLTDARQIGPGLMEMLKFADSRANPPPPGASTDHRIA